MFEILVIYYYFIVDYVERFNHPPYEKDLGLDREPLVEKPAPLDPWEDFIVSLLCQGRAIEESSRLSPEEKEQALYLLRYILRGLESPSPIRLETD